MFHSYDAKTNPVKIGMVPPGNIPSQSTYSNYMVNDFRGYFNSHGTVTYPMRLPFNLLEKYDLYPRDMEEFYIYYWYLDTGSNPDTMKEVIKDLMLSNDLTGETILDDAIQFFKDHKVSVEYMSMQAMKYEY